MESPYHSYSCSDYHSTSGVCRKNALLYYHALLITALVFNMSIADSASVTEQNLGVPAIPQGRILNLMLATTLDPLAILRLDILHPQKSMSIIDDVVLYKNIHAIGPALEKFDCDFKWL